MQDSHSLARPQSMERQNENDRRYADSKVAHAGMDSPDNDDKRSKNQDQQGPYRPSESVVQAALQSLPVFGPSAVKASFEDSTMIAVQYEDCQRPAIVMSKELVGAISAALEAGLDAICQQRIAAKKIEAISKFEDWARRERDRTEDDRARDRRREHISIHEHNLDLAGRARARIEECAHEADATAKKYSMKLFAQLGGIFDDHGLLPNQDNRFGDLEPDDEFLAAWKVPEADVTRVSDIDPTHEYKERPNDLFSPRGRSPPKASQSGRDRARSRSSSPRKDLSPDRHRYRNRSPRRDSCRSGYSYRHRVAERLARKPGERPDNRSDWGWDSDLGWPEERAVNRAWREYRAAAHAWRVAEENFDKRHEQPAEEQHEFERFNELNRLQIEGEERFREARRRCRELGIDLGRNQTSDFTDGNHEESARKALKQFCGPEKYPKVKDWLELVVDQEAMSDSSVGDGRAAAAAKADEWQTGRELGPEDCIDSITFGRLKEKIRKVQAAGDGLRDVAKERWAEREGKSTSDWDHRHWG